MDAKGSKENGEKRLWQREMCELVSEKKLMMGRKEDDGEEKLRCNRTGGEGAWGNEVLMTMGNGGGGGVRMWKKGKSSTIKMSDKSSGRIRETVRQNEWMSVKGFIDGSLSWSVNTHTEAGGNETGHLKRKQTHLYEQIHERRELLRGS